MRKEENKLHKEENRLLAERATNVSYVMSDLNTKLKDLENEKASLLTVIKILQSEQVHESNHGHLDWKPSRKCVSKHGSEEGKTAEQARKPVATSNKYSALQIAESDDETSADEQTKIHCSSIIRPCIGSPDNNKH